MFKKLTIQAKLIYGFLAVSIIAASLGIFGTYQLKVLDKSDQLMYDQVAIPLEITTDIATNFQKIRIIYRDIIEENDVPKIKTLADSIHKVMNATSKGNEKFKSLILTDTGKALYDKYETSYLNMLGHVEEIIVLALENKDEQATALRKADLRTATRDAEMHFNELVSLKIKVGHEISDKNTSGANQASVIMISLVVMGVVVAMGLGLLIAFNIKKINKQLLVETNQLVEAAVAGNLNQRADVSKINFEFQAIPIGINKTLDAVIGPLNVAAKYVDRISKGNIPERITDNYNGDFNEIKNNLNVCIDSINALVTDAAMLSQAAIEGKLATRADATKHEGDFRRIVQGVNDTLDAVIGPLNVAAGYVDRISKGNIPEKITDNYNGDFNTIKNNLNLCIASVDALVADAIMLAKAAVEGKLATRADATKHQGDFRKIVEGVNDTLDSVIGPLNVAALYVDKIAKGDMPEYITDNYNGDFNNIKSNLNSLIKAFSEIITKAKMVAQGDLTITLAKRSENDELMAALSDMVSRLSEIVGQVMEAAQNVAISSSEMSTSAVQISEGASEQSASAEEVSSSIEEMTSGIQQNSDNSVATEKIAVASAQGIIDVNSSSQKSLDAMRQISEKIKVINDIAGKTDILAINAAIEAARAGEQGKGFAVVAAEVRKLAEVSQKAAIEINELAASTLRITEESGTLMMRIIPEIQKTAQLVKEIAASSHEQRSGSEQITKAVMQFTQVTQQNAAAAEEMSSSSEELASQAELLKETIGFFNTGKQLKTETVKPLHKQPKAKTSQKAYQIYDSKPAGFNLKLDTPEKDDKMFESY
jgi:methyl-accepting chemotaxis protein